MQKLWSPTRNLYFPPICSPNFGNPTIPTHQPALSYHSKATNFNAKNYVFKKNCSCGVSLWMNRHAMMNKSDIYSICPFLLHFLVSNLWPHMEVSPIWSDWISGALKNYNICTILAFTDHHYRQSLIDVVHINQSLIILDYEFAKNKFVICHVTAL